MLDSMESRFLNEEGDLACKLMAALQGANMVGADTRCATNGTSSLFAFVKVAPVVGPQFLASVRTGSTAGIEPIDSLQTKFNLVHSCGDVGLNETVDSKKAFKIFPNPVSNSLTVQYLLADASESDLKVLTLNGSFVLEARFKETHVLDVTSIAQGIYIIKVVHNGVQYSQKFTKE